MSSGLFCQWESTPLPSSISFISLWSCTNQYFSITCGSNDNEECDRNSSWPQTCLLVVSKTIHVGIYKVTGIVVQICRSKAPSHQCCVHFLLQSAGRLDKALIITANTSVVASVCALTALDQQTRPSWSWPRKSLKNKSVSRWLTQSSLWQCCLYTMGVWWCCFAAPYCPQVT